MNQPILCIGELLIDFFNKNTGIEDSHTFTKKAGGAPANVCAAIAKLGGKAHFCGKVGNDSFGEYLEKTLLQLNVDTNLLVKDSLHPTTLAFVSLQEDGQRDFIFYQGADAYLSIEEVPLDILKTTKLIHFGSATALLPGTLQKCYWELLLEAKNKGAFISFDPNYRLDLWKQQDNQFIKYAHKFIANCDFLKVSDEELQLLTNESNMEKAVSILHSLGAKYITVTLGKNGTFLSYNGQKAVIPSRSIQAVDTTGAGDAFVGAVLYRLSQFEDPSNLSFEKWQEIVRFGNKVGAKVCEKIGAIEALPTLEEVID